MSERKIALVVVGVLAAIGFGTASACTILGIEVPQQYWDAVTDLLKVFTGGAVIMALGNGGKKVADKINGPGK